ncbi:TSUP family transporter [Myroides pelagicus]|uniref:Probable membrane transporter protein n=1 Tax=Myroides pelagicus TaxID=270914 RepID=A0A7K1GHQ2_9FLAO|nr:TSUP family transporter [Myroides pelagicus]MTH28436.1 TSUP family transporter [Myroides pelagicus]
MENTLFPIFLKTNNFNFLIVGGGNVGLEKARTLLKQNQSTRITVVSTCFKADFFSLAETSPHLVLVTRDFREEDLIGKDLVVIATNDAYLNKQIKRLANERKLFVNAADQPDLCDFYLGSIVNKGQLKIAISTNGKSPVLARRLREYLEDEMPENISESIENLNIYRSSLKGSLKHRLHHLNRATTALVASGQNKREPYIRLFYITSLVLVFVLGYAISNFVSIAEVKTVLSSMPSEFYYVLAIGFFAQLVDGALGLGYGMTSASAMMAMGISLPAISGSIHSAEMFSSAVSGYTHYKFGNVNKKLLLWLCVPGVVGATLGSLFVIYIGSEYEYIAYPFVALYLMIIAVRLISLALRSSVVRKKVKYVGILGFSGGFFDAFGGGGWGPIVTSTLLTKGRPTHYVIGTVSLAEFFVTFAASVVFFSSLGFGYWYIFLGLAIGGTLAAPLAARLAGRLPKRLSYVLVGLLVFAASLRIVLSFWK